MATLTITAYFSDKGTPKTGLTPKMDGWKKDQTHVINNQNMTEIAGGWYYYDFATYDEAEDYVFRADGTVALNANDRYKYKGNSLGQVTGNQTTINTKCDAIAGYIDTEVQQIITNIGDLNNISTGNVQTACDAAITANDNHLRILGLSRSNVVYDTFVFDGNNDETSRTVWVYNSKVNANNHDESTGLIGKYKVVTAWTDGKPTKVTWTKES